MTAVRRTHGRATAPAPRDQAQTAASARREPARVAKPALGMIETRGLVALFEAVDAALKAATVTFTTWEPVGSGLVTAFVEGEVAAVKAAVDAGADAAKQVGEVVSVVVIPRPHDDLNGLIDQLGPKAAAGGAA
ncbi:MAG: BMC domain-containing protein [Vicinamibacterales bacterium]|nr:BMC domain-containing protein [Vicinamibacterales bacterium]